MKITPKLKNERGMTFVLVVIVIIVTSVWLISLTTLTNAGARNEGRRITLNETLATADGSLELAWARWRSMAANSSTLPTTLEVNTGWEDDEKVFPGLNTGVTVDPDTVYLRQVDPLGRIMKDDQLAEQTARTDISRGLIKRSVSYVATVTAEGQPIGGGGKTVKMEVNRVFQKSDIPLFQFLAFFDHTLFLHNGPAMVLGGRLHSNKRIFAQSNNTLTIRADMSGPSYNPQVYTALGVERPHADILADINALVSANKHDEIAGFFYGMMIPNWANAPADNRVVLENGARYNPSGKMSLFDPNDTEYQTWWGDSNNDGKQDWVTTSNENVNGGFRELIEKPVTNSAGEFNGGQEDTLFISEKRFYNQANIKIEYNSSASGFANSSGVIDPTKITIYYKDLNEEPGAIPPDATDAQKLAAMKAHMAKELVPADLKTEILKALTYQPKGFVDPWVKQEYAKIGSPDGNTMDAKMDVVNIDMAKLKAALDAWTANDIGSGSTPPNADDGVVLYIGDTAANPNTAAGKQKGVRFMNAAQMPNGGLTLATDMLAYVWGDYNTGGTGTQVETNTDPNNTNPGNKKNYNPNISYRPDNFPSAILADNIRLLSRAWTDANSTQTSSSNRVAQATTYNMAMVMGDKFTDKKETDTGGLHNFCRFVESWGNNTKATINGAFIQLWDSKHIRYKYDNHGDLYQPPIRHWNFASAYLWKSPPGTLDAVEYTRGQYWISMAP